MVSCLARFSNILHSTNESGVVIAGFGAADIFPALISYNLGIIIIGGAKNISIHKGPIIRSVEEFEKLYYPDRYEKQREEEIDDPQALGIYMANESLEKINSILK